MGDTKLRDDRPAAPQLFVSYARDDLARAEALHGRLVAAGFSVWFDKARLTPGCDWHKEIEAGCEAARVVLPLITPRWAQSEWTRYETYAHDAVIPVLAEGKPEDVMPPPLRRWNAVALDPLAADAAVWDALVAAIRLKLAEPVPERAPCIVDLPYTANPFFTGRDDDLVRIHEELHAAPVAALTQGRVRALAAMGGIGKTTLANEYARRYWRLYPQILWVDARAGLESGFALLFGKLFPGRSDAGLQQPDKAAAVLRELSGRAERLLVLDNVEDAESVRPWLVRDPTSGCRTLITSRFADWPAAAGIRAIQLYVLEPGPARQFLLARTGRTAEGAELAACDDLARELGYLPLALEQAAAYMAAPGAGVNFAGYLRLYRAATADLLARGALGSTEYPDPVIATWQTTAARLSPESRGMLRLCAYLADTPIPCSLALGGAAEVLALAIKFGSVAPAQPGVAAELRMRDALTGLARYSMVLDSNDESFRVHGLVQAVERLRAEADGVAETVRDQLLARLTDIFPSSYNKPALWPLCRMLLPHNNKIAEFLGEQYQSEKLAEVFYNSANFLSSSGNANAGIPFINKALEILVSLFGDEDVRTVEYLYELGYCLLKAGNIETAIETFKKCLRTYERERGENDKGTLMTVNALAYCLREFGDFQAALPLFRRALSGGERVVGTDDENTLYAMDNLAGCLREMGEMTEALTLNRRAMETRERLLGADNPDTLTSIHNLAAGLYTLGDYNQALPLFRRVTTTMQKLFGPEHPETLIGLGSLAACLSNAGDTAEALALYRKVLDLQERVLGAEHPNTLLTLRNLGSCLSKSGDPMAALPLLRRALDSGERALGSSHPGTLASVRFLATCMEALGDAPGALPLYRRALDGRERVLGPDHLDTLKSMNDLAGCLDALGQTGDALALHEKTLRAQNRKLGNDHPDVITTQTRLAHSLRKSGHPEPAEPHSRASLEASARVLGETNPLTLYRNNNLSITLLMLHRVAEARAELAATWNGFTEPRAIVTPGTAFLAAVAALMSGQDPADPLGRLKALLSGSALEKVPDVAATWDILYLIEHLQPDLPPGTPDFLRAVVAAINDSALAADLDRFPLWRDAPAVPLDTPWPNNPA